MVRERLEIRSMSSQEVHPEWVICTRYWSLTIILKRRGVRKSREKNSAGTTGPPAKAPATTTSNSTTIEGFSRKFSLKWLTSCRLLLIRQCYKVKLGVISKSEGTLIM